MFNQLSNIKIVGNELFKFYDKNLKYLISERNEGNDFDRVESVGIWQGIKVLIDESISHRKIVDSSISSDSGSLLNFINKQQMMP